MITEPDVTLTDWALAAEAAVLAVLAARAALPQAWVVFFAAVAGAGLLGGLSHGFFADGQGPVAVALWRATLLALGVTAAAAVSAGARALGGGHARTLTRAAILLAGVYAAVVLLVTDVFLTAVVAYLPATLFLLGVFLAVARRTRSRTPLAGALGLGVLLLGSWVQVRGIALPALGLGHNAVYHVVQMIALPLVYRGARGVHARER